jgi:hypothetical protein
LKKSQLFSHSVLSLSLFAKAARLASPFFFPREKKQSPGGGWLIGIGDR